MTDRINIVCDSPSTLISLPQDVRKMANVSPQFLSMCLNMSNISAQLGNNTMKLTQAGSTITIPDGCYSLYTFNRYLQTFDAVNTFYKIQPSLTGTNFDMCVYTTAANRSNDTG